MSPSAAAVAVESPEESIPTRPLLATVLRLGAPSVLENTLVSALVLTDSLMLAQLPDNGIYLAATAVAGVAHWRMVNVFGCTATGAGAYVARRWGEQRYAEAGRGLAHAILIAAILGLVGAIALSGVAPLLLGWLCNGDPQVTETSTSFYRLLMLSLPARLALLTITSGMRASGDTRSPLLLMALMLCSNICLNYVLIFGHFGFPALHMNGAGIATSLSYTGGMLAGLWLLFRGVHPRRLLPKNEGMPVALEGAVGGDGDEDRAMQIVPAAAHSAGVLRLTRDGFRLWFDDLTPKILRVSRSALGEEILVSIGFLSFLGMVGKFGRDVMAAHGSVVRVESLSYTAGWGVAVATATMVGQALGARRPALARRLFSLNATVAFSMMGVLGILFALYPGWLLHWFELDAKVMPIAIMIMCVFAIEQPIMGVAMTLSGGLRGAGDTYAPFLTQIAGVIGMRIGMGYLLAWPLGMGISGIYWATVMDWAMRMLVLSFFVWRGGWQRVKL